MTNKICDTNFSFFLGGGNLMNDYAIESFISFCDDLYIEEDNSYDYDIAEEGFYGLKRAGIMISVTIKALFAKIKELIRKMIIYFNTRKTVEVPSNIASAVDDLLEKIETVENEALDTILGRHIISDDNDPDYLIDKIKNNQSYKILQEDHSNYTNEIKVKINTSKYRKSLLESNKAITTIETMSTAYKHFKTLFEAAASKSDYKDAINEVKSMSDNGEHDRAVDEVGKMYVNRCRDYIKIMKMKLSVIKILLKWNK